MNNKGARSMCNAKHERVCRVRCELKMGNEPDQGGRGFQKWGWFKRAKVKGRDRDGEPENSEA